MLMGRLSIGFRTDLFGFVHRITQAYTYVKSNVNAFISFNNYNYKLRRIQTQVSLKHVKCGEALLINLIKYNLKLNGTWVGTLLRERARYVHVWPKVGHSVAQTVTVPVVLIQAPHAHIRILTSINPHYD